MLLDLSIKQLSEGLKNKRFSSLDLVNECYESIDKLNPEINAFITLLDKGEVIKKAKEADKKTKDNILQGMPFVIKDPFSTKGIRTTAGSNVLGNYIPQYNSTVYQKIIDAGAILIGKTNMDAWGHGASTENTDFNPTKNPWDLTRVAGGSSGGNAAAITARMAAFAIGEDTGGSIRNPSGWCNITGLKVTYGRVSRYGVISYVSSFDTMGPMAKNAEDCAIILKQIAGYDNKDATSYNGIVPDYVSLLDKNIQGKIIGMPKECFETGLDPEIKESLLTAAKTFENLGVKVIEISMPMLKFGVPVYYLIGTSETSTNLARYDGIRFGTSRDNFSEETIRRIMLGTFALSAGYYDAYYKKAQQGRTLFIKEYQKALSQCDAILMPIEPMGPTKFGELINDPIQNMLADIYTCQTPTGLPSLAIPCGFMKNGLPVGMQLLGKMFNEDLLLNLGYTYQQKTDWHRQKPPLFKE